MLIFQGAYNRRIVLVFTDKFHAVETLAREKYAPGKAAGLFKFQEKRQKIPGIAIGPEIPGQRQNLKIPDIGRNRRQVFDQLTTDLLPDPLKSQGIARAFDAVIGILLGEIEIDFCHGLTNYVHEMWIITFRF